MIKFCYQDSATFFTVFAGLQEKEERTGEEVRAYCLRTALLLVLRLTQLLCAGKNESEEKRELIFKEDGQGETVRH